VASYLVGEECHGIGADAFHYCIWDLWLRTSLFTIKDLEKEAKLGWKRN
jgi:hypothetical protein